MGIPITLTLPEDLLEQARQIASLTHQDVRDLLVASISLPAVADELYPGVSSEEAQAMAREEAAWQRLHPELIKDHERQYVAILQGQLVDYDPSFDALFRRISERFPGQFVWLDRVRQVPTPILHFRSPRLADQINENRSEL
ncbi:MAG: hypothetical protein KDE09_16040 [Anaerolineales bacterium]|nr:hypothetical protein [Anaerolineales bacterium]MCB0019302.1 hypothetical protein [Anaerolineales bacterium]MCB0028305.1 hypothetical protein [Anaerolineales bacterium]